jgi:DNA modification methylase
MNHLYYGDNLAVLREEFADESVDLIYLDPPFNSATDYNVLFKEPSGQRSEAQVRAFADTWHWDHTAEAAFREALTFGNTDASEVLRTFRGFLKENDMMAYLAMMAVRLLELHRVLKPTGSLYLHCDPTASHYLKILLDAVFGKTNMRNEIIWKRTAAHSSARRWGPVHDTIFFYSKSNAYTWNPVFAAYNPDYLKKHYRHRDERGQYSHSSLTGAGPTKGASGQPWRGVDPTKAKRHWAVPMEALRAAYPDRDLAGLTTQERLDLLDAAGLIYWPERGAMPRLKRYLTEDGGVSIQDVVTDIGPLSAHARERLGYPTQKPLALLERIIEASSNPGDLVLDPFCGCGTAVHAAQKFGRRWAGIDVTHLAISLIERRLKDAFPGLAFAIHGTPTDIAGARALAAADKYQFQWWAVSLVEAMPFAGRKKGADGGIDGLIYFQSEARRVEKVIVSVKAGDAVGVDMIRSLRATMEREGAAMGLFLTLAEPTKPMRAEAAAAGAYTLGGRDYPRIQILTTQALLEGAARPDLPPTRVSPFRMAEREDRVAQDTLL